MQPERPAGGLVWVSSELALATEAKEAPALIWATNWLAWAWVSVTITAHAGLR